MSGIPAPASPARPRRRRGGAGPRRNASRSSLVIRPFGPVAVPRRGRLQLARQPPDARPGVRAAGIGHPPAGAAALTCGVGAGPAGAACAGGGRRFLLLDERRGWGQRAVTGVIDKIGLPRLTRSPTLTRTSVTVPAGRGRHVHGGLVGLQGEQRILLVHPVARGDVHLDDRDVVRSRRDRGRLPPSLRHASASSPRAGWACPGRCRSARSRRRRWRPARRRRRPARRAPQP